MHEKIYKILFFFFKESNEGPSLVVHWLRRQAATIKAKGLIPGQGTKIQHKLMLLNCGVGEYS